MDEPFHNALTDEIDRLREENRILKEENASLKSELIKRSTEGIDRLAAQAILLLCPSYRA
jgi:cell division protein FtsB